MTRQLSCFNSSWCQTTDRLGPLAPQVADAVIKAISPKLQLLSGHTAEQSLAMYRALTLGDMVDEYEAAMRTFPVR